tara:strand:- start:723 stop:2318 length:1596 start_codon:yes stop_codon:yes gene_type:complete
MNPPVEPLFALLRRVAERHDRNSGHDLLVIPVVVDDAAPVLAGLEALCEAAGGWLGNAEDEDLSKPISDVSLDPALVAALETALTVDSGPTRRTLKIVQGAGSVDVTFTEIPSIDSASDAETRVLKLARLLLRPDAFQHELAVIYYREQGMDVRRKRGAWSLVVDQLRELRPATLRTLVVLVEGAPGIDVGTHCQFGRGFDYALADGRLIVRNPRQALEQRTSQLAAVGRGPLVLFLGAGFSQSSGLPMGNALRDQSIRRILGDRDADRHLTSEALAREFREAERERLQGPEATQNDGDFARLLTFERVLRVEKRLFADMPTLKELLERESEVLASPGPSVRSLHQMLAAGRKLVVVTVNLDRLAESGSSNDRKVFASDEDFGEAEVYLTKYLAGEESAVPILKVHGSLDDFETCVVTDNVTLVGLSDNKRAALSHLIGTRENKFAWVYVGASMRDLDLLPFLQSSDFAAGVEECWVSPYLVETVSDFTEKRVAYWRDGDNPSIQDHLVTETADAFFESLAGKWSDPSGSA